MAVRTTETQPRLGTESAPTVVPEAAETIDLSHEWTSVPRESTVERTVVIDPTAPPTKVVARSRVIATAAERMASPEYLASVRRRRTAKIAKTVRDLEKHTQKQEFAVWTQEPLNELRKLIRVLSDAEQWSEPEHEGNSCEILRQIRDSFLNVGWRSYRKTSVRDCVAETLEFLSRAEEVGPDDARRTMDQLLDLDLDPSVGMLFSHGEEETEIPG
jgi:hypothetical protein